MSKRLMESGESSERAGQTTEMLDGESRYRQLSFSGRLQILVISLGVVFFGFWSLAGASEVWVSMWPFER